MFLWKDKEVNNHILKTKIRNRSVILSAVAICEPKKNRFHDRVMENYYVTSWKVNIIYCYKKGSVVHPKSQIRSKKVIRGQLWVKLVKKESNRAVCLQYTYVLTKDKSIFRLKSYFFLIFLDFLTSNGTKGGWDESIHIYMTLCCKWKKRPTISISIT